MSIAALLTIYVLFGFAQASNEFRVLFPEGPDATTLSLNTVMSNLGAILVNLVSGVIVDSLGIFTVYRISLVFLLVWRVLYSAHGPSASRC